MTLKETFAWIEQNDGWEDCNGVWPGHISMAWEAFKVLFAGARVKCEPGRGCRHYEAWREGIRFTGCELIEERKEVTLGVAEESEVAGV